jgi:hypothetical protein
MKAGNILFSLFEDDFVTVKNLEWTAPLMSDRYSWKPLISLVPGEGVEPSQPQGPRDFKCKTRVIEKTTDFAMFPISVVFLNLF